MLVLAVLLGTTPVAVAENGQQTTLLVSPSGQPVGGWWQQWMNDSYMPTYNGTVTLDTEFDGQCGQVSGAVGCTTATPPNFTVGIVARSPELDRQTLLYEQAHVLDLAYLTAVERSELLALWRRPMPAGKTVAQVWWAEETHYWGQPVMGEWFAADYSLCALHRRFTWALMDRVGGDWVGANSYPVYSDFRGPDQEPTRRPGVWRTVWLPPTRTQAYWLQAQQESCALIRYWILAAQHRVAQFA